MLFQVVKLICEDIEELKKQKKKSKCRCLKETNDLKINQNFNFKIVKKTPKPENNKILK